MIRPTKIMLFGQAHRKNARDSCHSNFPDPWGPILTILNTLTNFFWRKKRFWHQKRDAIKQLKK
jgi:hypothetical protein